MTAIEKLQEEARKRHTTVELWWNVKRLEKERERRKEREYLARKKARELKKAAKPIDTEKIEGVIRREALADAFKEVMEMEGLLSFVYLKRYKPAKVKVPKEKLVIEEVKEPAIAPKDDKQKIDVDKIRKFLQSKSEPTPKIKIHDSKPEDNYIIDKKENKRPPAQYSNRSAINDYI